MFQGAIIVFCLLIIFIAACIMPWWFIPAMILGGILFFLVSPKKY